MRLTAWCLVLAVLCAQIRAIDAFGPRPRPRLYAKVRVHLPRLAPLKSCRRSRSTDPFPRHPLVTAAPSPASHRRRARAQGARAGRTGRRRLAQRRDMAGARHGTSPEAVITAGRHPSLRRIERVRDLRRVRGGIVRGCAIHDRERDAHEPRGDAQEGEGDEPQEVVRGVLPTVPTHRSHGHRGG